VSGSLALLADAGHMLTDAADIGLASLAIWFGGPKTNHQRHAAALRRKVLTPIHAIPPDMPTAPKAAAAIRRYVPDGHPHGALPSTQTF
jgi:hypothetical protein